MKVQIQISPKRLRAGDTVNIVPWAWRVYRNLEGKVGRVRQVEGSTAEVQFGRVTRPVAIEHLQKAKTH